MWRSSRKIGSLPPVVFSVIATIYTFPFLHQDLHAELRSRNGIPPPHFPSGCKSAPARSIVQLFRGNPRDDSRWLTNQPVLTMTETLDAVPLRNAGGGFDEEVLGKRQSFPDRNIPLGETCRCRSRRHARKHRTSPTPTDPCHRPCTRDIGGRQDAINGVLRRQRESLFTHFVLTCRGTRRPADPAALESWSPPMSGVPNAAFFDDRKLNIACS